MDKQYRKTRLNPSKLLVLLMYGTYPYVFVETHSNDSKKLTLTIGKFAKLMRVRNAHIVEYCQWLEKMGYIIITNITDDKITVILSIPPLFNGEAV